jgi:hypothetical protein
MSQNRWRCGPEAFGLCANLRLCDESTDSQAVLPISVQTRVNQLRNIALGRAGPLLNTPTSRSVLSNSAPRPSHPQHFPQDRSIPGRILPVVSRDANRDESGRRFPLERLLENSILLLFLGGAALQRCGKWIVLNPALAAEGTGPAQKRPFPQPVIRRVRYCLRACSQSGWNCAKTPD